MPDSSNPTPNCLVCAQTSDQVPLLAFRYSDADVWICPQHLPILIHDPAQLAGRSPGAEDFGQAEGHDHPR